MWTFKRLKVMVTFHLVLIIIYLSLNSLFRALDFQLLGFILGNAVITIVIVLAFAMMNSGDISRAEEKNWRENPDFLTKNRPHDRAQEALDDSEE